MKKGFTLVEIIFVILIIGILGGIAIPKLFVSREDAVILKAKDEIANVKVNIESYAQSKLYEIGKKKYPKLVDIESELKKRGWEVKGGRLIYNKKFEFTYNELDGKIKCVNNCKGLE